MITRNLKKEPAMLSGMLWDMLRQSSPIRTPEEEQAKLFKGVEVCALPESAFGRTIFRALRACLAMYKQTEHMSIHFVHSDISDIDVAFDANRHALKIHQKWLECDTPHRQHGCRDVVADNKAGQDAMFFCDHVIEELLRISLATISSILLISFHNESEMMRDVRQRLRLMPHSIDLKQSLPGVLMATWEDNETELFRRHYGPRVTYHVVLHDETCVGSESELLHEDKGRSIAMCWAHSRCLICLSQLSVQANVLHVVALSGSQPRIAEWLSSPT